MADFTRIFALVHVGAAILALVLGACVLARPKGTFGHRAIGWSYVALLIALDLAALGLHREATFGPFHILAVLSLATVVIAITIMVFTAKPMTVIATHGFMMAWSYAGLVAAGIGQLTVQLGINDALPIWMVILLTLGVCGTVIQIRVPPTLASLTQTMNAARATRETDSQR